MDERSSNEKDGQLKFTTFEVRPYKFLELARIYHVNKLTLLNMIAGFRKQIGQVVGHYLSITQVEIIIAHLKLPYFIKVEVVSEEKLDHVLEEKLKHLPNPKQKPSAREPRQPKKPKKTLLKKMKRAINPKKKNSKKK
jgi:hypothetical protein